MLYNSDRIQIMIFIGGTGRCGTTILSRILGRHRKIFAFPTELRFISDPDGLISLRNTLVENWSFFQGDFAVERFLRLMNNIASSHFGSYPNVSLADIVGSEFYYQWLKDFVNELTTYSYKSNWAARTNLFRKATIKILGKNRLTERILKTSYYSSPVKESDFYRIANKYLTAFFHKAARCHSKKHCVDATPSNLIHADFLYKCLPNMKLIHIYRDPRDVVSSFITKDWAPSDPKESLIWIADIFDRWEEIKTKIPESSYTEVRFENLIQAPESCLKHLFDFLQIEFEKGILDLDLSKHNIGRWEHDLPEQVINYFENEYMYLLERYGYE